MICCHHGCDGPASHEVYFIHGDGPLHMCAAHANLASQDAFFRKATPIDPVSVTLTIAPRQDQEFGSVFELDVTRVDAAMAAQYNRGNMPTRPRPMPPAPPRPPRPGVPSGA
jgi:hypothetical protein